MVDRRRFLYLTGAAAHRRTGSLRDVEHIVVLMQENRSFDHYFGALRGIRGFGDPHPVTPPSGKSVWPQSVTICDAHHCSFMGSTDPNRYYMWSGYTGNDGTGGGPVLGNDEVGYSWTTYPERLQQGGISWKIYQYGLGQRVPMLVVSPWSKGGWVCSAHFAVAARGVWRSEVRVRLFAPREHSRSIA